MSNKTNQKPWMRFRHRVVRNLAYAVLYPYSRFKYGIRIEKFKEQGDRAYLILFNHQTAFDQFFVGMAFRGPVYYLASEDLFSNGFVSSLIRYLVAPIPIKKQTTDLKAVKTCIRVAREGATIALAPEGNRTYSGKTEYMSDSIVTLARKIHLPIALYRLEGGYGVHPRWSNEVHRGSMRGYVSRVIEPEDYDAMSNEELMAAIRQDLYVDDCAAGEAFSSEKRAEYLERALYVCPFCGLSRFESHGNDITCKTCGKTVQYGNDHRLQGVGCDFPFAYTTEWYDYQKAFVNKLDVTQYTKEPLYRDTVSLSEVVVYKKKTLLRKGATLALYGDRLVIDEGKDAEWALPFAEIAAISVLGRNKLNVYHGKTVLQIRSDPRFNALKYVNIYYRYKNISRGDSDDQFLGL